jgi:S-adenosylmethionine hydrolase
VRSDPRSVSGAVVLIDSFGNLITNIERDVLAQAPAHLRCEVNVASQQITGIAATYGAAPPGELVALFGSQGRLEVAVVNGNAAEQLRAKVGDAVRVSW